MNIIVYRDQCRSQTDDVGVSRWRPESTSLCASEPETLKENDSTKIFIMFNYLEDLEILFSPFFRHLESDNLQDWRQEWSLEREIFSIRRREMMMWRQRKCWNHMRGYHQELTFLVLASFIIYASLFKSFRLCLFWRIFR